MTIRRIPAAVGAAAIVVVLAVLVYLNALENGFAVDDVPIILDNPTVHGFSRLRELLLGSYWPNRNELYRPVVMFTYALEWAVVGNNPGFMHGLNVMLHGSVTLAVFLLVRRLGASTVSAFVGGAIFAVHPVHVESVANVIGRAQVLATLFVLIACLLHLSTRFSALARIVGVAICYFLALGSNEIAVSLPVLILLIDLLRTNEVPWKDRSWLGQRIPLYTVLVLTLAVHLGLRFYVLGISRGTGTVAYLDGISTAARLATAVRLWPEFARLLLWPHDLSAEWGPGAIHVASWGEAIVWVGLLLGLATLALAALAWKRARWFTVAVLWLISTLFLVSQVPFPIGVMLAERHLYLPSVALAFGVVPVNRWLNTEGYRYRRPAAALTAILLVLGAWRTWQRTPAWESNFAAYMVLGREHPESYRSYRYAAGVLMDQNRPAEAIPLLEKTVELTAGRFNDVNLEYSTALRAGGQVEAADSMLALMVDVAPSDPRPYLYRAEFLIEQREYSKAVTVLQNGYEEASHYIGVEVPFAHHLALAYDGLGRIDAALEARLSAMGGDLPEPLYPEWLHLARLHWLRGDSVQFRSALESARAAAPDSIRPRLTPALLADPASPLMRGWGS